MLLLSAPHKKKGCPLPRKEENCCPPKRRRSVLLSVDRPIFSYPLPRHLLNRSLIPLPSTPPIRLHLFNGIRIMNVHILSRPVFPICNNDYCRLSLNNRRIKIANTAMFPVMFAHVKILSTREIRPRVLALPIPPH